MFSRFIDSTGHRVHLFGETVEALAYVLFLLGLFIPDHHCKMAQAGLFLANLWLARRLKHHAAHHGQTH